jgi:hypothetical protein
MPVLSNRDDGRMFAKNKAVPGRLLIYFVLNGCRKKFLLPLVSL